MDRILLPVESFHSAKRALEYVMKRSKRERSCIHMLNVQKPIMAGEVTHFHTADRIARARMAAGTEVLRPVQALLDAEGIGHTAHVALGELAQTIIRYAVECGCASIVISTKGRSPIGNLVLGSVAAKVIKLADVPVTLIKQTGAADVAALLRLSDQYSSRDIGASRHAG